MFICEIWLFVWYFPQFCTSDMSKYGYLGSVTAGPFDFEITRVHCTFLFNASQQKLHTTCIFVKHSNYHIMNIGFNFIVYTSPEKNHVFHAFSFLCLSQLPVLCLRNWD